MTFNPNQRPFAWWNASKDRPFRAQAMPGNPVAMNIRDASRKLNQPQPTALVVQIRHFLSADRATGIDSGLPLISAKIYPFTGSNTPYQSHE